MTPEEMKKAGTEIVKFYDYETSEDAALGLERTIWCVAAELCARLDTRNRDLSVFGAEMVACLADYAKRLDTQNALLERIASRLDDTTWQQMEGRKALERIAATLEGAHYDRAYRDGLRDGRATP